MGELFDAEKRSYWVVDGTDITVVTDDEVPLGRIRDSMRCALARLPCPPCVHWSDSFQGVDGTHIHGDSWLIHVPKNTGMGLWDAANHAAVNDWQEVAL